MRPQFEGMGSLQEIMAPGSYLAASCPPVQGAIRCFDGLELIEPGLVDVREWRPEKVGQAATLTSMPVGGVGHKPLPWAAAA
ncbi:SAM-dependent methyltransferase [Nonomuraea sp. 10N515B]|uniref:SAM-dependent methyltransferase n=1 Tax=Nonomuraea sp. 10N515B TaxID=3457422 RepID=UPI003FCCD334